MDYTKLDTYQLDLLMVISWETLLGIKHKKLKQPSSNTVKELSRNDTLKDLIISQVKSDKELANALINETTTKDSLRHTFSTARGADRSRHDQRRHGARKMSLVCYQHSLDLEGCLPKHHRKKPKVKGSGFTGAILLDSATFLSYVELMLCYHAWCHNSSKLPVELQEDMELVSFLAGAVVQYFDTITPVKYTPSGTPTATLVNQCSPSLKQVSGDSKLGQRKLQEQHSSTDEMSLLKAHQTALEKCSCLTLQVSLCSGDK
jgi:hypothetical protein